MDQNIATTMTPGATLLSKKSWTAYVWLLVITAMVGVVCHFLYKWNEWAALGLGAATALFVIYNFFHIHSQKLYCDNVGVWLQIGVLPWSKGIVGVKWRDIDEATFKQNLFSWLFHSHTIRIGHRFTRASEIYLPSMAKGKQTVIYINTRLMTMIRDQTLN